MLYLIHGEDTFRSFSKLKELERQFLQQNFIVEKYDAKTFDIENFKINSNPSLFCKDKKLFVLTSLFQKYFSQIMEILNTHSFSIIFYEKEIVQDNNKLTTFQEKGGEIFYFPKPTLAELKKWAREEFKKDNYSIRSIALETLIDFVGDNLWQMRNEINKLKDYKRDSRTIEVEDVLVLVKPKIESDIFKTIRAIANKEKKTALRMIYKHLCRGDSPLYIFSMILYQFRILLILKNLETLPYSQRKNYFNKLPYQIKKEAQKFSAFSFDRLKKIYKKLFQLDLMIKKGKVSPEEGLELLLADI